MNKKIQLFVALLGLFMVTNCWYYSFKGTIPAHINSIAIPNFENQTSEMGIREEITQKVKLNFIQENILEVKDKKDSDSILYGVITRINDEPYTYQSSETGERVENYQIIVSVEVEWYDNVEDKQLFKQTFTAKEPYDQTGATDQTRERAIDQAVETLNDDIINSVLTIW